MKRWIFFFAVISCCLPSCEGGRDTSTAQTDTGKLYGQKCGLCHGDDGKLSVSGAKDLTVSTLGREEVIAQITYGKGSMPPQDGILTAQQIEQLADYTISLRTKKP